jgi:hypothetical protein
VVTLITAHGSLTGAACSNFDITTHFQESQVFLEKLSGRLHDVMNLAL